MGIFAHIDSNNLGKSLLKINDIEPLWDSTLSYAISFTGELYNKKELISEIKNENLSENSSDAEVVLYGYITKKEEFLNLIDGVFAFVVYDKVKDEVFVVRDHFGVKFIYYYQYNNEIVFASDIPGVLPYVKTPLKPNDEVIFDYLVFNRTDQTDNTFFDGIKKFPHGSYAVINKDGFTIKKWYDLTSRVKETKSVKKEFLSRFENCVSKRLETDDQWAVCLSGGLDSSAIVSTVVNRLGVKGLHTFSSVYGKEYKADESKFIEEFKEIVPNMHYINPTADILYADLEHLIKSQVEPTPTTSPYAHYCVLKEANANGVKITLDGQGSDEALAGYEYIPGLYHKSLFTSFKWVTLFKETVKYLKLHRSTRSLKYMLFFLLPSKMRTKVRISQRAYINPEFVKKHNNSVIAEKLYGSKDMQEMLINHFEYKLEHLLKWGERNASAFSMTSRMPFLDYKFVEYAIALEDNVKVKNGYTKFILRDVMKGIMPENVRLRVDKKGFSVPQDEWFKSDKFQDLIFGILNSESFRKRGYIIPEEAINLYKRHLSGEINVSKDIWKWINLEIWFRYYIDKK